LKGAPLEGEIEWTYEPGKMKSRARYEDKGKGDFSRSAERTQGRPRNRVSQTGSWAKAASNAESPDEEKYLGKN